MARPSNKQAAAKTEVGVGAYTGWEGGISSYGVGGRINYVPSLQGLPLLAEMERMWFLDETVGAMGFFIQTTLAQADWEHVACIDGEDDNTGNEDAKAAAKFCNSMLIDMEHSMQDHVSEAIMMIPYGFAPCEIICRQRSLGNGSRFTDNFWGVERIPLRDPLSIWNWTYDGGKPVAFKQFGITGSATVPLWKVVNYRASSVLDNPRGRPFLLNVHRAWRLKNNIQDSEAIGIERDLCGLPTFRVPSQTMDEANEIDDDGKPTATALKAQAKIQGAIKAVSDMRFNRSGGLIMPSDTFAEDTPGDRTPMWDFKLVTSPGQRAIDTRSAARDYDRAIARSLMLQFLHLGDRATGSYALSNDQTDISTKAMMSFAKIIAQEWNRKVLGMIWTINGWDMRYMPRLRATSLNKDGIQQLGQFISGIAKGEALWGDDQVARRSLLNRANISFDAAAQANAAEQYRKKRERESSTPTVQPSLPFGEDPDPADEE